MTRPNCSCEFYITFQCQSNQYTKKVPGGYIKFYQCEKTTLPLTKYNMYIVLCDVCSTIIWLLLMAWCFLAPRHMTHMYANRLQPNINDFLWKMSSKSNEIKLIYVEAHGSRIMAGACWSCSHFTMITNRRVQISMHGNLNSPVCYHCKSKARRKHPRKSARVW